MVWWLLLPVCIFAELVAVILAPVLPLFVSSQTNSLPRWLSWFQTPDNSALGDPGHAARWEGESTYMKMFAWFLRNRAYGFKLGPLGCPVQPYFLVSGDRTIGNRNNARAGYLIFSGDLHHWYFKCVVPIGFSYCIQLAFGWQLDAPLCGRNLYMFSPRITRFYRA